MKERSQGKDTTTGHWEMAGIVVEKAFATFPNGFAQQVVDRWVRECGLPGALGNTTASGTEIIARLGEEHLRTGKPILYTSADSVWQIAAHEEKFGLERLYEISKVAREICDELKISRVIARPFVGENAKTFRRTHHRKDYSVHPPQPTMMDHLREFEIPTIGIGKIWNIYNGRGITHSHETKDNLDGLGALLSALDTYSRGLIFVNLIDFDMNFGHRRDVNGFARALEDFDRFLPHLEAKLGARDVVMITADHGNDPTYPGTDHTREHVPLLCYQKSVRARALGDRESFCDLGQSLCHALTGKPSLLSNGISIFGGAQHVG